MRVELVFGLVCIALCDAVASFHYEDLATAYDQNDSLHERSDTWISATSLHARPTPQITAREFEAPSDAVPKSDDFVERVMNNAYGTINKNPRLHDAFSRVVMAKAAGHTTTEVDGVPSKDVLARLDAAGVVAHVECITRFEWDFTE